MPVAFPQLNVTHKSFYAPSHDFRVAILKEDYILPTDFPGVSLTAFKVSGNYNN